MSDEESHEPVLIDHTALEAATLRALIEDFVTRDGTDYGNVEVPLEQRVANVLAQLKNGKAVISFDPPTGSATIVVRPTRQRP
jgi:uncharacterized protein